MIYDLLPENTLLKFGNDLLREREIERLLGINAIYKIKIIRNNQIQVEGLLTGKMVL